MKYHYINRMKDEFDKYIILLDFEFKAQKKFPC